MRNDDIFDKVGKDGEDNLKAWSRLPNCLKYFIRSQQNLLLDKVTRKVCELYGEDGIKSLLKTSGFRSIQTNNRNGGVADSLHLFGCATDFAKIGIFKDIPIPTCCDLECIDSGKCWHIQFKRPNQGELF